MSKKITALSIAILILALCFTVTQKNEASVKSDVSSVKVNSYAASNAESTTSFQDYIGGQIGNITNIGGMIGDVSDIGNGLGDIIGGSGGIGSGLGGAIGDIGGAIGGILNGGQSGGIQSGVGGTGSDTYPINTETLGYIDIVPAASSYITTTTETQVVTQEVVSTVNETVDFAATSNPYKKPTGELKGGDTGEGVKWMQWIFIYTRYGLKDDGITGVFDEDTMAVVKKLQKSNGINVDGIVDKEVVDAIELLYFQEIYGTTEVVQTEVVQVSEKNDDKDDKTDDTSELLPLIIAVIVLWVVAIIFVAILFIKKKKTKSKDESSVKPELKQENSEVKAE